MIRRKPVTWAGDSFVRFRASAIELLRRRWLLLTVTTLAGQLTVFGVMLVSLRVTGVSGSEVSLIEAFAAWSIVRLLGSLPVTPGGIGIVEVGLTGALVGFGGHNAEVVAAVLVYRALTIVPTLVLGSDRRCQLEALPTCGSSVISREAMAKRSSNEFLAAWMILFALILVGGLIWVIAARDDARLARVHRCRPRRSS